MNLYKIGKIVGKEMRALSRNKRIMIGLFAPMILMPILFYGFTQFTEMTHRESEASISRVAVIGHLPGNIHDSIIAHVQVSISDSVTEVDALTTSDEDLILEYDLEE